ncbi:hypothetical protein G6F68_021843 [Rhizopus microsporus]|nr:hypothetical protein G6F68_021843 [Rhizopus microsporus]
MKSSGMHAPTFDHRVSLSLKWWWIRPGDTPASCAIKRIVDPSKPDRAKSVNADSRMTSRASGVVYCGRSSAMPCSPV